MITEKSLTQDKAKLLERLKTTEVYTIEDVLDYFCVSRPYFYRLVKDGKINKPSKKVGRCVILTEEEFNDIIASGVLAHKIL